ncbi:MAG: 5'-methylthioadenosine/adenosylhomocysteine nucleosidase [Oscillospiraceae bacterium]|nr:5'-methylthioadenosine/adenosylhomocysteine nucleosidase [Oscillospiraceae bacterium]
MIGIIGALKQEVELIKSQIQDISCENILGSDFFSGKIFCKNILKNIVISECSIGKVNAAASVSAMILKYSPDLIINTGISGSLDNNINILDIVVADKISAHDEGEVFEKYFPFESCFKIKEKYIDIAQEAFKNINNINNNFSKLKIGQVVTGDEFICSNIKKNNIKNKFKDSLTVDMEASAIAKVCFRAKKDFVVIKTISDEANDEAKKNYDNFIDLAAKRSAELTLEIINLV